MRCLIHAEYDGKHRPHGFCAQCWQVWVTAEAERYIAIEFQAERASAAGVAYE